MSRMKKGKPTWQPASVTDVVNKEDGYRYRWANKSPDNLAKKQQEGWETVSGLTSDSAAPVDDGKVHSGQNLTSTYEKHDVILMRMDEETALSRDDYYNTKSKKQVAGLTAHAKKDVADGGGEAHGDITISSRMGAQIIK